MKSSNKSKKMKQESSSSSAIDSTAATMDKKSLLPEDVVAYLSRGFEEGFESNILDLSFKYVSFLFSFLCIFI